jgi:hypothetical protein
VRQSSQSRSKRIFSFKIIDVRLKGLELKLVSRQRFRWADLSINEEGDAMPRRPAPRFTIGQGLILVAAIALILYAAIYPSVFSFAVSYLTLGAILVLSVLLVIRRIVERNYGISCPGCSKPALERRGFQSFGERFYLCPDCGVRCRRSFLLGIFGIDSWEDASTPEFDDYYEKPKAEDPWNSPPGLEDDEESFTSKTHANLVRNKRLRRPENPNGPGLE